MHSVEELLGLAPAKPFFDDTPKSFALITGSSSGIGLELAHIFANEGTSLILVARNKEALNTLAKSIKDKHPKIDVLISAKDLSSSADRKLLYQEIEQKALFVEYLVNNAGFGDFGAFIDLEASRQTQMIELNCTALTELSHYFLQEMKVQKKGKILNIASVASFQPGPLMAVYYATKAYVLSFSEALHAEVKPLGIGVTALCPGPTKTKFFKAANAEGTALTTLLPMQTAAEVAQIGFKALQKNKRVAIPGLLNKFIVFNAWVTPKSMLLWVLKKFSK